MIIAVVLNCVSLFTNIFINFLQKNVQGCLCEIIVYSWFFFLCSKTGEKMLLSPERTYDSPFVGLAFKLEVCMVMFSFSLLHVSWFVSLYLTCFHVSDLFLILRLLLSFSVSVLQFSGRSCTNLYSFCCDLGKCLFCIVHHMMQLLYDLFDFLGLLQLQSNYTAACFIGGLVLSAMLMPCNRQPSLPLGNIKVASCSFPF